MLKNFCFAFFFLHCSYIWGGVISHGQLHEARFECTISARVLILPNVLPSPHFFLLCFHQIGAAARKATRSHLPQRAPFHLPTSGLTLQVGAAEENGQSSEWRPSLKVPRDQPVMHSLSNSLANRLISSEGFATSIGGDRTYCVPPALLCQAYFF